jgi:hypothetical protein
MLTLQRRVNRIQYMVWPRASRCGSRADESSHVGTGLSLFAAILITACLAWPPRPAGIHRSTTADATARDMCAKSERVLYNQGTLSREDVLQNLWPGAKNTIFVLPLFVNQSVQPKCGEAAENIRRVNDIAVRRYHYQLAVMTRGNSSLKNRIVYSLRRLQLRIIISRISRGIATDLSRLVFTMSLKSTGVFLNAGAWLRM